MKVNGKLNLSGQYSDCITSGAGTFSTYFIKERPSVEVSVLLSMKHIYVFYLCLDTSVIVLNHLFIELYEYCMKEGYADKNLIAKWKKQGYENLCCLRCIQTRDTNFGTNCICRVPKSKLEVVSLVFFKLF